MKILDVIILAFLGTWAVMGTVTCVKFYLDRRLLKRTIPEQYEAEFNEYVWIQYLYVLIFWYKIFWR